jgi:hypothetical protein
MITICIVVEALLLMILCVYFHFIEAANKKLSAEKNTLIEKLQKQQSFFHHQKEILKQQIEHQTKDTDEQIQWARDRYQEAVKSADEAKLIREKNKTLESRVKQLQSELYRARQKSKRQQNKKQSLGSE